MRPALAGSAALLVALAGCGGGEPDAPPQVRVTVGPQDIPVQPSQYCLSGEGERYSVTPPIIEVSPDSPITLTVPEPVAERGWGVQVFDDQLEEVIGEVDVEAGAASFAVNSSDVVPAGFYLVVVENAVPECDGFSGAWPVGFIRAG
ncbi:DUF2771 family protein [Trujillonella humicola]|uniref:DUF2771 family protein n=1 Tax=Trujillonella humicola TaxID=3383699 RepID=UPI00390633CE